MTVARRHRWFCWGMGSALAVTLVPQDVSARQPFGSGQVILRASYTSTSKIYNKLDAVSEALRNSYLPVDNVYGGGVEGRIPVTDDHLFLALSADYVVKSRDQHQSIVHQGTLHRIPGKDGLVFVPVEIGLYSYVPLGIATFRMTMGGGPGVYYASPVLEVGGVSTSPTSMPMGYGIHISFGFEYRVAPAVWLRGELKFRDPEVNVESTFDAASFAFQGSEIPLPQAPIRSRINIDGTSLAVGLMLEFP